MNKDPAPTASHCYTPGPWKYDDHGAIVMTGDGQMSIADMRGCGRLTANHGSKKAIDIMDTNGRLVTQAPVMFEALRMIRGVLNGRDRNPAENEAFHTANKALLKNSTCVACDEGATDVDGLCESCRESAGYYVS